MFHEIREKKISFPRKLKETIVFLYAKLQYIIISSNKSRCLNCFFFKLSLHLNQQILFQLSHIFNVITLSSLLSYATSLLLNFLTEIQSHGFYYTVSIILTQISIFHPIYLNLEYGAKCPLSYSSMILIHFSDSVP